MHACEVHEYRASACAQARSQAGKPDQHGPQHLVAAARLLPGRLMRRRNSWVGAMLWSVRTSCSRPSNASGVLYGRTMPTCATEVKTIHLTSCQLLRLPMHAIYKPWDEAAALPAERLFVGAVTHDDLHIVGYPQFQSSWDIHALGERDPAMRS